MPARIVVPANAKQVKKDAILAYGAEIIECEPSLQAREDTLRRVVEDTGANFVPPYDDDRVIAGQGTVALEMIKQIPDLDVAMIPVGGGGLLAGCLLGFSETDVSVIGIEPEGADDACVSLKSGVRVLRHEPQTICDGLLTTLGKRNFSIIKDRVADIILVSDDEVISAMRLLWTRLKIIVEPSAAAAFAGLLRNRNRFSGKRIGLVLTGGNVDLGALPF